jgi:uncharacterized NAD-dependent epimerase/dehydratase family protein
MSEPVVEFARPFAVFLGDVAEETFAKTGLGLVQWCPEACVGQVRLPGCRVDAGVPDIPVAGLRAAGVRSLVIGAAQVGGRLAGPWLAALTGAAEAGIDIVSGLHTPLVSSPELAAAAARSGARLVEVRVPPAGLPVGTGRKRTGKRLLTVGTDCASGKKYTALALHQEFRRRGIPSDFRATGQTGIMIAGRGIPMDAVVSDFATGAAEVLTPAAAPDHWDLVEGQGALFHPGYLQVTVALLVGSQPDAFVVCHDPLRRTLTGWPDRPLPGIAEVIARTVDLGRLTNPAIRCVGIALITAKLDPAVRAATLARHADEFGLPCVDPLVDGTAPIVDAALAAFP